MKALILQHAASEGPGLLGQELTERGYTLERCALWEGELPQSPDCYHLVLILGGAMNIYQHRDYPWLVSEKAWLSAALAGGMRAIGICLGAQLLADVLGGKVMQNPEYEVGWWPVDFSPAALEHFPGLPPQATFMHWHGDTFSLPAEAISLASSPACANQGFLWRNHVLACQFHPEVEESLAAAFADDSGGHWPQGPWVQAPTGLVAEAAQHLPQSSRCLRLLLDRFLLA